jgi:tripartite-type tricarboxylate transporter receptor subunit TctC
LDLLTVPFSGASAARTAFLAGDINVTTANLGEALNFSEGHPWTILGIMAAERSSMAPDISTFAESGYEIRGGFIRGFAAPAGLKPEVLDRLTSAFAEVANNLEYMAMAAKTNQPLNYIPRGSYVEVLNTANALHRKLWEAHPWIE